MHPSWYFEFWIGHISATGHPMHFMFRSCRVRVSGSADIEWHYISGSIKSKMAAGLHLGIFEWPHVRNRLSDRLHVWFWIWGVGGSIDTISGEIKPKMSAITWRDMTEDMPLPNYFGHWPFVYSLHVSSFFFYTTTETRFLGQIIQ